MRRLRIAFLVTLSCSPLVAWRTASAEPQAPAAPDIGLTRCRDGAWASFAVPDADLCLRLSGRLRFDIGTGQRFSRLDDVVGMATRATLGVEASTPTDVGPLLLTMRMTVESNRARGPDGGWPELEYAALDWNGATAGRATSYLDRAFPTGGVTLMGGGANGRGSDRGAVNLLGYRMPLFGSWAATASLEDPMERRVSVVGAYQHGARWPDLVLTAAGETRWGRHHVALALHETRPARNGVGARLGYAIQSSAEFSLPYLPTTVLRVQSAAAYGASDYTGWGWASVGGQTPRTADLWLGGQGPRLTWTGASSLALIHRWSPAVRLALFTQQGVQATWPYGTLAQITTIGANAVWSPVPGMEAGAEVAFERARILRLDPDYPAPVGRRQAWSGRFRLQQDF
ncbi:hypothetical protein GCM10007036_28880 [Alsobacter metallidurans]|uniref:Porin n=1 Tax=Alsobacter metallidurans TaxID=340221 RepID=A0A917I7U9_9HYPH|nr:porin [Alsobacter metallidurans]GGH23258.1 hypothetical protein GCM10007036_28880 [Alsobacter metallidurans]